MICVSPFVARLPCPMSLSSPMTYAGMAVPGMKLSCPVSSPPISHWVTVMVTTWVDGNLIHPICPGPRTDTQRVPLELVVNTHWRLPRTFTRATSTPSEPEGPTKLVPICSAALPSLMIWRHDLLCALSHVWSVTIFPCTIPSESTAVGVAARTEATRMRASMNAPLAKRPVCEVGK